ncbi:phosphatidylinositol N-acetylglucosaminyltransferase subunit Q [Vespula maculifrons]|uniref:Phosphatidylinositol N-acetylglucosaminyltransferase subunit Q n=1 Tax=Vespula maculifrons TaxID=7453 RepID=A0ABD2BV37_VESMC
MKLLVFIPQTFHTEKSGYVFALQETELLIAKTTSNDHFYELMKILQMEEVKYSIKKKSKFVSIKETFIYYHTYLCLIPILFFLKITNKLLPILKYSSLGLHLNGWLENAKWILINIIQKKRITLKTGSYISATIIDILFGVIVLQLSLCYFNDISPSEVLLKNAEASKVVESLKNLIQWLMGAPAGLKLNYAFNNMLGKFFLYHIHLWWTFLIFMTPVMDFAFEVLLLFGRLGITFQISIASDFLALISFHTYCIYVYAARLFNIQLNALISLFRLFLGKKKNPLRERVDSCQYKPDQLFVGTLLFTILLFLVPTTWVYYTVFTMFRLLLTGFSGLLARLRLYFQVTPVYAFIKWLFNSYCTRSSIYIKLHSHQSKNNMTITLWMTMVTSSWGQTWKNCVIDTIAYQPSIKWSEILNSIIWGQLIYPLYYNFLDTTFSLSISDTIFGTSSDNDSYGCLSDKKSQVNCDTNIIKNANDETGESNEAFLERTQQRTSKRKINDKVSKNSLNHKATKSKIGETGSTDILEKNSSDIESLTEEKISKRRKRGSTALVESNGSTGDINTNVSEESAKETETPSKRKIKREKAEQREAEKREATKVEATQKALTYVRKWKYSKSEWKFEKIRQIWLMDNLLDDTLIPDEVFPIVLEYFEGCKGMAREQLLKKGMDVVRIAEENIEKRDETVESVSYKRARLLLQALPTET